MVKLLWTTGVVALAAAAVVCICCIFDWVQADPATAAVATPSAVERFMQTAGRLTDEGPDETSALVRQARAFALYLNPPPPVSPVPQEAARAVASGSGDAGPPAPVRPPASSPKFELHGISYYRDKPEQSAALICEPDGRRRWVRQGAQIGHLTIERIYGDCVLWRNGDQIQTMALASSEALARFAQKTVQPPAPKQAGDRQPGTVAPPPMRGIRQMPRSRATAKLDHS